MFRNKKEARGLLFYGLFFGAFLIGRLFSFWTDAQKQVEQDAKDSGACHTGHLHAKEGDIPSKGILPAQADNHDGCNDGNIFRAKHVHLLIDHDGDSLGCNSTKQENFQAADGREVCGEDGPCHPGERSLRERQHYARYRGQYCSALL